jgi:hypothetical protein
VVAPTEAAAPAPAPASAVALLEGIAADIEALAARFPQLAAFRAATHLDRARLVIEYGHHTHPATHHGGWTSGVPNPDPDGIWLYVDLHDPADMAQIHTQPDVPMVDALGQKLELLVLEGSATTRAQDALRAILRRRAAEADPCGRPADGEPPSAHGSERVTLDELLARKPRTGRFTTEGWVQIAHHCGTCPPGALCKPCEEIVWLSPMAGAYKDPLARDQNLVIAVPDARRFDLVRRYRVTVVACGPSGAPEAPLTLELRGFERLP